MIPCPIELDQTEEFPKIPSYSIIRSIGGGSYGEVFLARTVTGSYRALKVVKRENFDLDRTFEREFEGIQHYEKVSQGHAGLVDILHVGREPEADFYYYVMDLADDVSGKPIEEIDTAQYHPKTLDVELRNRPVRDIDDCVEFGIRIAEALAHLHSEGLSHRDVKPSNIIFQKGEPRLADIGLVARSGQRTFVGTEGYVPPEGPGTCSSDLYALAMVLYEMHTGKDRFEFPELPTNHQLPTTINRDEWRALNLVICRGGAPDPRKRFEDGTTFAAALREILEKRQEPVVEKKSFTPPKIPVRWMAGGGAALLVALITLVVLVISGRDKDSPQPESETGPSVAVVDPPEEETEEPLKEATPKPEEDPPTESPAPTIVAEPASCLVKIESNPSGATVWMGDQELDRTPIPYRDFEHGKLSLTFKKEGFYDKTVDLMVSGTKPLSIRETLKEDYRPKTDDITWFNSKNLQFEWSKPLLTWIGPVTPFAFDHYQSATQSNHPAVALNGVQIVSDPGLKWDFCDWMTQQDRSFGFLDETMYLAPIVPPPGNSPDAFFCAIKQDFGTVSLKTNPPGSEVYLGNTKIGETPGSFQVRKGPFRIRIERGGYQTEWLSGNLERENPIVTAFTLFPDQSVEFGKPWENTLGMTLVPIGDLMVASCETRSLDYDTFLNEATDQSVNRPAYTQPGDHPVVGVSRADAKLFCEWLTQRERQANRIRDRHRYRLPTDREWSMMAGLPDEKGSDPKSREQTSSDLFPWGSSQWPPPANSGNFADASATGELKRYVIPGFLDGYAESAPVGQFNPTSDGLYDLSGNVWEWVSDDFEKNNTALGVVRGGSWESYRPGILKSAYRNAVDPNQGTHQFGFRYVLEDLR